MNSFFNFPKKDSSRKKKCKNSRVEKLEFSRGSGLAWTDDFIRNFWAARISVHVSPYLILKKSNNSIKYGIFSKFMWHILLTHPNTLTEKRSLPVRKLQSLFWLRKSQQKHGCAAEDFPAESPSVQKQRCPWHWLQCWTDDLGCCQTAVTKINCWSRHRQEIDQHRSK